MNKQNISISSSSSLSPSSSVLNTFLMWSLIRSYLPFMSKGYRSSLEYFERTLYGIEKSPANWYFCTKLVKLWMPLAVDVLQNYPNIQKVGDATHQTLRLSKWLAGLETCDGAAG